MKKERCHSSLTQTQLPRVLIAATSYLGYDRAVVEGVVEYVEHHASWELVHELGSSATPETLSRHPDVDGIIATARKTDMQGILRNMKIQVVMATGPRQELGLPLVVTNNKAVGPMAIEYFYDLGFKTVGYYGKKDTWSSQVREKGFKQAANEAGIEYFVRHVKYHGNIKAQKKETQSLTKWLQELPKPVAILGVADTYAHRVATACHDADILVPEEVALLGVDNDQLACKLSVPPLSSIDHGAHRIGYEAAALLARLLEGEPAPKEPIVVEPVGVVTRQSTNTLAIRDQRVAQSVRYIREHACEGIQVKDVLKHVTESRRALEMHFKKYLNRTINQEIVRVKVERAKELLVQTDWDTLKISLHCGFSHASRLSTTFKRETNSTPRDYRKRFRNG